MLHSLCSPTTLTTSPSSPIPASQSGWDVLPHQVRPDHPYAPKDVQAVVKEAGMLGQVSVQATRHARRAYGEGLLGTRQWGFTWVALA